MAMTKISLLQKIKTSFTASIGDIVFGMEDGTVSIFGLVAGVALDAKSGKQVLLAGAAGAIAASVSMMAGVFLDLQSEQDQAKIEKKQRRIKIQADPDQAIGNLMKQLQQTGLSSATLNAIQSDLQKTPLNLVNLTSAFNTPTFAQEQKP